VGDYDTTATVIGTRGAVIEDLGGKLLLRTLLVDAFQYHPMKTFQTKRATLLPIRERSQYPKNMDTFLLPFGTSNSSSNSKISSSLPLKFRTNSTLEDQDDATVLMLEEVFPSTYTKTETKANMTTEKNWLLNPSLYHTTINQAGEESESDDDDDYNTTNIDTDHAVLVVEDDGRQDGIVDKIVSQYLA